MYMRKLTFFIVLLAMILTIFAINRIKTEDKPNSLQKLLDFEKEDPILVIPKGTYDISSEIIINKNNVTIDGSGSTLLCKSKITCISLSGNNIVLKNFKVN